MDAVLDAAGITRMLGFEDILGTDEAIELRYVDRIQEGIPIKILDDFINTNVLTKEHTYQVVGSHRTIARRHKTGKLSPEESDKFFRLIRTVTIAVDVFGNTQKAEKWFYTHNHVLADKAPVELLNTEAGTRLVETILERIAHGVFS